MLRIYICTDSRTVALHCYHRKKRWESWLLCHRLDKTNLFLCTGVRNHIINDWLTVTSREWVVSFYANKWQTESSGFIPHFGTVSVTDCRKPEALCWRKHSWDRTITLCLLLCRSWWLSCVIAFQNICLLMVRAAANSCLDIIDISACWFLELSCKM